MSKERYLTLWIPLVVKIERERNRPLSDEYVIWQIGRALIDVNFFIDTAILMLKASKLASLSLRKDIRMCLLPEVREVKDNRERNRMIEIVKLGSKLVSKVQDLGSIK